jgi:hypothetical protein
MKHPANRAAIIQVVCVLGLLFLAQPAWAAPGPTVPKGEVFDPAFFPGGNVLGSVCDFPIRLDQTSAQTDRHTFSNGLILITGSAVAKVTNQVTGKSATFNISGPFTFDPATQRVAVRGTNLILGPLGSSGPNIKFLIFTSGTLGFILNNPIDVPLNGTVRQDVCAALS